MTTPYSTAMPYAPTPPSWISNEDRERLAAYMLYENMYDNVPQTFKLAQRGSDADPVYIPTAKIIIEATNRFLAKNFTYMVDPNFGSPEQQALIDAQLRRLFKRENFYAKFATQRRYGLIRGDAVWHITADPAKPAGSRISINDIDPGSYFPIYADDDKLVGCHLVDQWELEDGTTVLRRQTYRKTEDGITSECKLFEIGAWDDRVRGGKLSEVGTLIPLHLLPSYITALPVYHIKNGHIPGAPFGTSELKGLERLFAAVNQAVSDEELALALDGLGVYATTSGPPVDKDGNEVNWRLGPGRVVELEPEATFSRVSGVSTIAPFLEHVRFIMGSAQQAAAIPDIAAGNVDVTIAESGIALAMHLSPLLAKNAEKEVEMLGIYDHMLYDLVHMWLPSYEDVPVTDVEVVSVVDDPMPTNQQAEIDKYVGLYKAGAISLRTLHMKLVDLGIDIPQDEINEIMTEKSADVDLFGARMISEVQP